MKKEIINIINNTAIINEQITITFYLWKERDNETRLRITKDEVNEILEGLPYVNFPKNLYKISTLIESLQFII